MLKQKGKKMKKIIMLAGAIAIASVVNAASYTWGFSNGEIKAADGNYFGEGAYTDATAYLFLGTITKTTDGKLDVTSATLITSGTMNGAPLYNWGNDSSSLLSSDLINEKGGQVYSLLLLDSGSIADFAKYEGKYILSSGTSVGESIPGTDTTTYYANLMDSKAYGAGDWSTYAGAIPEPTSGLLLLVGVAGLALRRRKA